MTCSTRCEKAAIARQPLGGAPVPVDEDCIPTSPTYSLKDFIPPPIDLTIDQLRKLYKLSALEPPKDLSLDHESVKRLRELAAIVEGVRLANRDGKEVENKRNGPSDIIDARVRAPAAELVADRSTDGSVANPDPENLGTRLLELAAKRDGAYFTVPTPENIRGKKRSSSTDSEPTR
ncbi:hypothetical protein OIV83_000065 [Microbotryomycetes sp. JL201]|nr:hypothetical protein OIV83_000065 [Microbotryomycetes sp. JL201]